MGIEDEGDDWGIASIFFRPGLLLQGIVEYFFAWNFTRRWSQLLLIHAVWLILLVATVGIVGYGASLSRKTLVERYGEWVSEELPLALQEADENATRKAPAGAEGSAGANKPDADPASDASEETARSGTPTAEAEAQDGQVSTYGELLLRRLLQLEDSNSRITYLVALQLAQKDRLGQARQMMRRIAPTSGGGFIPAHAWLATDQINAQQIATAEDKAQLMKDLAMAASWANANPALLGVYADLLESQGELNKALSVLDNAYSEDSNLTINLKIARIAAKHGQKQRYDRAAQLVKDEIRKRMENDTATSAELSYLANLFLIEQTPLKARQVVELGLSKDPQNLQLRRLLSESFRIEYLLSIQQQDGKYSVNLSLLDAALKTDPTNPGVGAEVARLITAGQESSPELRAALEDQLSSGQSTALTHVLLANRSLADGDLQAAIPHLETALYQAPNSPVIMNNLGLALARTNPDAMERALQLCTAAVNIEPKNANFRDSLGEVRALSGDKHGAIECYEAAVLLDGSVTWTRKKLADLYLELGMTDMAAAQEKELKKLQASSADGVE